MRALITIAVASILPLSMLVAQSGTTCGATPNVQVVGVGSAGAFGTPSLDGIGVPQVGVPGSFHFEISGGVPFAPGVLVLSRTENPTFSATYDTTLWGAFTVSVPFVCDDNGHAVVMPGRTSHALNMLCGLDLIAQATVFDFTGPGGATWTNGLRFRFGTIPPPGG
jgi:hypothetical protein